jgi:putative salt-induced outer membrane protein YdiY
MARNFIPDGGTSKAILQHNGMIRLRALFTALAFAALLAAAPRGLLAAQQLLMKNGDRLTGTVIKREDGKIYFRSDLLGDIVAPANQVTIVELPPPTQAQSLAGLPPQPPKEPEPSVSPSTGPTAPVAAVPSKPGPWWWAGWPSWPWVTRPLYILKPVISKWTGKVEFGYGNELTNVRTVTTTVRGQADRNVGPDEVQLKALYLYGSTNSIPTTDQDELDFRWRHNLDERWFTQALTSYSSDKIRLINTDFEQTADLGYKILTDARQTLDLGAGAMVQYFDATGVDKGSDYLGNAFQDYTYKINGRYTFAEDAAVQYSPERRGRRGVVATVGTPINTQSQNYDYKFHATLQGKVTDHLSLNLHFEYEYNNAVLDPHERADQHFTTTLGYGF